jgi:uridine phosphorylase
MTAATELLVMLRPVKAKEMEEFAPEWSRHATMAHEMEIALNALTQLLLRTFY